MKALSVHFTWAGLLAIFGSIIALLVQYQDVITGLPDGVRIVAIVTALGGLLTAFGVPINHPHMVPVSAVANYLAAQEPPSSVPPNTPLV